MKTCHPPVISKKKILVSEDSSDLWTSLNKFWVDNFPHTFRQNLRPYRQKYSQCAENSTLKSRVISQNNIIEKSTANLSEQTVNNIEVKLEQSDDFDINDTRKSVQITCYGPLELEIMEVKELLIEKIKNSTLTIKNDYLALSTMIDKWNARLPFGYIPPSRKMKSEFVTVNLPRDNFHKKGLAIFLCLT